MSYHILKIIQFFIFPPGIFIVFFFLAAFFVKRFKKAFLLIGVLFYLLSTQFIGNLLLKPLEEPFNKPLSLDKSVKLVVVLGGGYYEGSSNLPLSQSAFKRAIYGYKLSRELGIPLLYNGSFLESKSAKQTYNELFSDTSRIYYENKALNTLHNASLTKEFLKKHNLLDKNIYLVTSAYHIKRALLNFKAHNIKALPAATDFLTSTHSCYCFFFPSIDGLRLSYFALHEYLALLRESFR